jgi:apolipoprotein N-acyltransferase
VRARGADLGALAAGALTPLGFAPWEAWPAAVAGLAGLFALWLSASPARAALRGWLFGVGLFGVGASWVRESFQFSEVPAPAAIGLTALFVVFLALYPALAGYLAVRFGRGLSPALRAVAVFPAAWVLLEWVRGWLLTGFPWLQVGYTQVDGPLAALAPVIGAYGVGWAVAAGAGLVVVLAVGSPRARGMAVGALALLVLAGRLAGTVSWTSAAGPPLRVAVVQGNVAQTIKWRDEERAATLALYRGLTRGHWDADLVVWPETAIPAFAHRVWDFIAELTAEAVAHGSDLLTGVPYADPETGRYYNSVIALGAEPGLYHKRHLVPFGEYVPLAAVLGRLLDLLNAPMSDFSAGRSGQPPLAVAGTRVGVSICYEDAFGEQVAAALPGAEVLVNVSNDAWFGDSVAPHQHQQMARMRALETGRDLVRATNTGVSAIIDWRGRVTGQVPQFQVSVLRGEVTPRRGATPYVRTGDLPAVLGVVAVLVLAGPLRRRRA